MTKQTAIKVRGADDITLSSPKGSMQMRLEGGTLVAKAGGKELALKPEVMAEIEKAANDYRPARYEQSAYVESLRSRYGSSERAWEAEDESAAFMIDREPKEIDPGTGEIVIWTGREDLA